MYNRFTIVLAATVGFVALLFGMVLNERIKMPNVKSEAKENARQELRAGVDSDTTVVGAGTAKETVREFCREASKSGVKIMPADEFVLLCLEGIEQDGTINEEGIARLRAKAYQDQEERQKRAATGGPSAVPKLPPAKVRKPAAEPVVPKVEPAESAKPDPKEQPAEEQPAELLPPPEEEEKTV